MEPPAGQAWTAGQVARHLGISESTLRTWHRRYGLSPLDTEPGHYRRYRASDVARLVRMVELIGAGMLASEAARVAQGAPAAPVPADRDVAALVAAARTLDSARCGLLLDALLARRDTVAAWDLVCRPALLAVDAHADGDPVQVAAEHTLSWALLGALQRLPRLAAAGPARVLLACTGREQHTLPLAALAAALADRQVSTRMLGPSTPSEALERAVRETRPEAVVIWSQRSDTADPGLLRSLRRYRVTRVAAGPGWTDEPLDGSERPGSLAAALEVLSRVQERTA